MSKISSGSLTVVDVKGGSDGINTATVYLYQRAQNAPEKPQSNITYTFNTATLSGGLGSWQTDLGQLTGTNPIWVIAAVAHSNGISDVISPNEWVGPTKLAQDGTDGEPGEPGASGTPGLNQATVFIYKRASSVTKPSNSTYTFATGNFTVDGNWEKTIPTATTENRNPCWVCSAVAIGSGNTAELVWSNPSLLVENGSDGLSPIVTQLTNGVKIVDADGNETFITNGSDGQSYYTHVRYSENANGSNYVTTPTSDTIYVGIYSGLSSIAPPYNDSGWTWSRYVGQKGEDGQSATQYYAFVKYATDDTGANMQDSPAAGYNYVGTYAGTNSAPSASDFQWSKYVGEDGQQGQPGQSAIQYYAFVRYATDSSGTGMTENPTANTIYVGTYTGQLANPIAQDYKWSKYVGTDGNDGDDGVSVTGIKEVYFLTTGAAPAQSTLPNGTEIISTSTASGQWTTVVPTYIANGKYYTSIQTNLDKGTSPIFSNIVLNQGLTDANKNAYDASIDASEAKELSRATQQHFWFVPENTGSDASLIEAGAYITDTPIDTFKNGKSGGYLLARSDGLELGRGTNKFMTLSATALNFYRPGTTTIDAQLTSTGLNIANGSIELANGTNNSIKISNSNFTRSINSISRDDLRMAIGDKFGVASDGTLYANGAKIAGDITVSKLTVNSGATISDENGLISNSAIEVGGRNLLKLSDSLSTDNCWTVESGTIEDGIAKLNDVNNARIYQLPANGYWTWTANTVYTVSVEARTSATGAIHITPVGCGGIASEMFTLSTEWKRYSYTFSSATVGTGSLSIYRNAGSVELRKPKLEIGNKATDWTPAPEDVNTNIALTAEGLDNGIGSLSERISGVELQQNSFEDEVDNKFTNIRGLQTAFEEDTLESLKNLKDAQSTFASISELSQLQKFINEYIGTDGYITSGGDAGNPYLEIGKKIGTASFYVQISSTEMGFYQNGVKVAYINSSQLYITNSEVLNEQRIGAFNWKVEGSNRMSLVYSPK